MPLHCRASLMEIEVSSFFHVLFLVCFVPECPLEGVALGVAASAIIVIFLL